MSTFEIMGPSLDVDSELLRDAFIVSSTDRNRSATNGHRVRLGLRNGDNTSWLGTYQQADHNLKKGVPRSLLDERHKDKRIKSGQALVIEVKATGSPTDINGTSVHFTFIPSGSASGEQRPLVSADTANLDPITRQIIESVVAQQNSYLASGRRDTVPLSEPNPAAASIGATSKSFHDYSTTTQTVSSTSYVDGSVSVAVVLPDGATTANVIVNAFCSHDNSGQLRMAISDGSSEIVEVFSVCPSAGDFKTAAVSFAGEITADTTYTLRLLKTSGSSDQDVERQGISALVVAA